MEDKWFQGEVVFVSGLEDGAGWGRVPEALEQS